MSSFRWFMGGIWPIIQMVVAGVIIIALTDDFKADSLMAILSAAISPRVIFVISAVAMSFGIWKGLERLGGVLYRRLPSQRFFALLPKIEAEVRRLDSLLLPLAKNTEIEELIIKKKIDDIRSCLTKLSIGGPEPDENGWDDFLGDIYLHGDTGLRGARHRHHPT